MVNFAGFNANPPASETALAELKCSDARIPDDYLVFLRTMNGGEGFLGEGYLQLWAAESLLEANKRYSIPEFAPWLFVFGSNGGGEAFGFDLQSVTEHIIMVPFASLSRSDARTIANNFPSFLQRVFFDDLF